MNVGGVDVKVVFDVVVVGGWYVVLVFKWVRD